MTARTTGDATDCVKHSYGQVQNFFRRQPCTALHRALFEVRDRKGDVVLVAVSWVQMPDEAGARTLLKLLDTNGSGNVTELSREKGRYRTVRYTGDVRASHRDGADQQEAGQSAQRANVGVGRVRHPIDLPEGYHTPPRAQALQDRRQLGGMLRPGCRAVGLRQVDGMPHEPRSGGSAPTNRRRTSRRPVVSTRWRFGPDM